MAKVDETLKTYYPLFDEGLYSEVVHQNGERAIKILKGDYKGTVFQYGKIELVPRAESEIPTINFDRAVRVCPENLINLVFKVPIILFRSSKLILDINTLDLI